MKRLLILLFPIFIYSWLIFCISISNVSPEEKLPATEIQQASVGADLQLLPSKPGWQTDSAGRSEIKNKRLFTGAEKRSRN